MGEDMANIFENIQKENVIFKDKQPLDHRFLPEKLLHRQRRSGDADSEILG